MLIRIIGIIALIAGILMFLLGGLGIIGSIQTGISPWVLAMIGPIFFFIGYIILKDPSITENGKN